MNYEYLTFNYDEPSDPYESLSDSDLVVLLVKEAKRVSPHYAIGWMSGIIKDALCRGINRNDLIRDIEYLNTREKEND